MKVNGKGAMFKEKFVHARVVLVEISVYSEWSTTREKGKAMRIERQSCDIKEA